jgi:hypothetical protein
MSKEIIQQILGKHVQNGTIDMLKINVEDLSAEIIDAMRPVNQEMLEALKLAKEAIERTPFYVNGESVWINSRTKGSAMWGLQDAIPETIESFKLSIELDDKALAAIDKALASAASGKGE